MSKFISMIIVAFIIFMACCPAFVSATDINMNLASNTTNNETLSAQSTTSGNNATISTLQQLPESELGLANILNIILIVIGILLVLLAIAIIIRLKS